MQILVDVRVKVSVYRNNNLHASIACPSHCPNCHQPASLIRALGYYGRYITDPEDGKPYDILVRRFLCFACLITISLLPIFCHPYRLVDMQTFMVFLLGNKDVCQPVMRWEERLRAYAKRFTDWLPHLGSTIGWAYGRAPPNPKAKEWTLFLQQTFGSLGEATKMLVEKHAITLLGRYQCHQKRK